MTALLTLLFIAALVFLLVRALSGLGSTAPTPSRPEGDGVPQWSDNDDADYYADYSGMSGDDDGGDDGGDDGADGGDGGGDGGD